MGIELVDLEDESRVVACPRCGGPALSRHLELDEGGSIRMYDYVRCGGCRHHEGDRPPGFYDGQWPIPD
jgi:hypothetical protein